MLVSTATEAAVIDMGFKVSLNRRQLWTLCGANGLSAGIAFLSLILNISRDWFPSFFIYGLRQRPRNGIIRKWLSGALSNIFGAGRGGRLVGYGTR